MGNVQWIQSIAVGPREREVIAPYRRFHPILTRYGVPEGIVILPKGVVYDGASTPRIVWTFYPPFTGPYRNAVAVHDGLYRGTAVDLNGKPIVLPHRKTADIVMRDISYTDGAAWWEWRGMYRGVRMFSKWAWDAQQARRERALREWERNF